MPTLTFYGYQLRPASVSTAVLAVVCLIILLLARRNQRLTNLFWESLTGRDGRADERKMTTFAFAAAALFVIIRGCIFNSWPPEGIFTILMTFIGAGLGWTTWSRNVLNKAEAEQKKAETPQKTEITNGPENPVPVESAN